MVWNKYWNEKDKENLLETITYSVDGTRQRNIGKVVSKRIYEYIN